MQTSSRVARVHALASRQRGVVSRAQVLDLGLSEEWLARQVASRRWQRVHRGVYAVFTGPLPWESRCWAAVLYGGAGAALAGDSALRAGGMRLSGGAEGPVTIVVDHVRRVRRATGVEVFRVKGLARLVHPGPAATSTATGGRSTARGRTRSPPR